MPRRRQPHPARRCERQVCGKSYIPKRIEQRFCTPKCRMADWNVKHPRMVPWTGRQDEPKAEVVE